MKVLGWLKDNPRGKFALFGIGSIALLSGLTAILIAEFRLPPSDFRSYLVLGALAISFLGAVTATVGYVALSVGRIARFFDKEDHVESDSEPDP